MAIVIPGSSRLYRMLRMFPMLSSRLETSQLLMNTASSNAFAESFRLLALNVNAAFIGRSTRGVVVMSAYPKDGRSIVAANLASALAEHRATILHDGHRGSTTPIATMFAPDGGSHEVRTEAANACVALPDSLRDIAKSANRSQMWLTSARNPHQRESGWLGEIIRAASDAGIATVVDSPPATVSSEAFVLAQEVGQVVYVVRRVVQDMDVHRQIKEQLQRLNAQIVGLVVNEV